jgi:hypothetical protein
MSDDHEDCADDNEIITCWCGVRGTFDQLFDKSVWEESCGGTGILHCFCGGDLCVCHHHGYIECHGCEDCEPEDDFDG